MIATMIQFSAKDKYLSTAEAAAIIGLSESSLRVYVSQGKIEARKIGSCLFFLEKTCKNFAKKPRIIGRPKKNCKISVAKQ